MAPNASTGRRSETAENEIMKELLLLMELQHAEEMAELERQAEESERRTEELKRHYEELKRQIEEKQRQAAELSRVIEEEKCRLEQVKRRFEFLKRLDDEFVRMNAEWTFLTLEENQCRIDKLKTMVESFIHTTGDDDDGTFASIYAYLLRVERARGLSLISSVKVTEHKDEPSVDDDVQCVPSGSVPLDSSESAKPAAPDQ